MKNLLGNLLPLTEEMNRVLGNGPYADKRQVYRDDSSFKAARQFAEEYADWTPEQLLKRSSKLASWVVERWPA